MRVLLLLFDHPANPRLGGGGALRMRHLSRFLAARGHTVHWVAGWFPGCESLPPEPGLTMTFLGRTPKFRSACYALATLLRLRGLARDADIVVEDFSAYSPVFSCFIRRVPLVLQIQNHAGAEFFRRNVVLAPILWMIEALYPLCYPHIIVVGDAMRQHYGSRAEVVPQGVSSSAFAVKALPEGDYIAFLGRIDFHQKGLDLLLEAAARTGLALRIAGRGPDLPRLRKAISGLPNVAYIGYLEEPEKFDFLAGARFAILPSRFEGEPVSLTETAACGGLAIVSSIPEMAYAVERGFALSFRTGSAEDLAQKMEMLWNDAASRGIMGAKARAFAADRSWDAIGARFEKVLAEKIDSFPG